MPDRKCGDCHRPATRVLVVNGNIIRHQFFRCNLCAKLSEKNWAAVPHEFLTLDEWDVREIMDR